MNEEEKKRKPKNLHVHYLSYEDRALATRLIEALETLVQSFIKPKTGAQEETLQIKNNTNNPTQSLSSKIPQSSFSETNDNK